MGSACQSLSAMGQHAVLVPWEREAWRGSVRGPVNGGAGQRRLLRLCTGRQTRVPGEQGNTLRNRGAPNSCPSGLFFRSRGQYRVRGFFRLDLGQDRNDPCKDAAQALSPDAEIPRSDGGGTAEMAQVHVMERDWWTKAWCGGKGRPVKRDACLVAWLLAVVFV